jgi:hypothetical protein
MTALGKPEQDDFAKQVRRIINEEEVKLNDLRDFDDVRLQIGRLIMMCTCLSISIILGVSDPG